MLSYLLEITCSEVLKVNVWLSSFEMYHFCCKTLSFANESKNTLDETDDWQIALKSRRADKASVLKILFVANDSDKILEETIGATFMIINVTMSTNDSDKIFKESDNWNQVLKIKGEIVNTFVKMSVSCERKQ